MKKRNQLLKVLLFSLLFSCNNVKTNTPKEKAQSKARITTQHPVSAKSGDDTSDTKRHNNALSNVYYSFSNDTLCQTISIKKLKWNKKTEIPEALEFKLVLNDKKHKYDDKTFEGVAKLISSEESFNDNSENDGGDYFAADYEFKTANYQIQIRIDVAKYDACVISIRTSRPDILGGFGAYLKEFPDDGVMKRGVCK